MKFTHFIYSLILIFIIPASSYTQCIADCSGDETRYGEGAGLNNTAPQVSIFGRSAGLNNTGDLSSLFGFNAGRNNGGTSNSFFGHRSGIDNSDGDRNSFFGHDSGFNNTFGDNNSFFGADAGLSNTIGGTNAFFGRESGRNNTTGFSNSFYGESSGRNNIGGTLNSFFGRNSGHDNSSGTNNAFLGSESGSNNFSGNNNTFLGSVAGNNNTFGSNNIAIGHRAGPEFGTNNVDSTLYIDVFATNEPLIYGHFEQRVVRINGEFEAMGGTANGSDINLKNEIVPVEEKDILEKLATIQISEWAYKDQVGVRHIGPMAQDFFKAFSLGNSDKTINTIDADGVSLAAIQALYKSLEEEKMKIQKYEILISSLVERIEILESRSETNK